VGCDALDFGSCEGFCGHGVVDADRGESCDGDTPGALSCTDFGATGPSAPRPASRRQARNGLGPDRIARTGAVTNSEDELTRPAVDRIGQLAAPASPAAHVAR
jgi:hypothetical protein